jgi:hypothetical protein
MERGKGPVDLFPVEGVHACTPAGIEGDVMVLSECCVAHRRAMNTALHPTPILSFPLRGKE